MLKFISFGSGSSGNCYGLFADDEALLIDAGLGIRAMKKHFREYGLPFSKIRHILVTHDHADHVKSVGNLSQDLNLLVHTTRDVHEGINKNYCVRPKIGPERRRSIEKGQPFMLGGFTITPFGVPHDSTDNVGYRIERDGIVFCVMTDVGHVTDEMKRMIADAQYLVIEANHDEEMLANGPYPQHLKTRIMGPKGHLSNRDCAIAIAENATEKLRHVWLCHLSEENNHPELARKTVEQVLRSYGIAVGKDFDLEVLKRKSPSGMWELEACDRA